MKPIRIFISSVQREFAQERVALFHFINKNALLKRFFDVFLFENLSASNLLPQSKYLSEVEGCDIYVGIFGIEYGRIDESGLSATEQEFDCATEHHKFRLIFVKEADPGSRNSRMQALIEKAQANVIRKKFKTSEQLKTRLYEALVEYLNARSLIRSGPFEAEPCISATMDDLDPDKIMSFIRRARDARQFPLAEDASITNLLQHLALVTNGSLTNAAILLFGKSPQRFLISSVIKCAHFHGVEVAKPIPSYQTYRGTVFELVDQAVDFVLSKINLSIGTRKHSVRAPRTYEIPKEVITEAIVNAVAHRDYTDNGSVQVMLFSDRLVIHNPGRLQPPLTLASLRVPHRSIPGNPLLAQSMYFAEYIEQLGTGTLDMIRRCEASGLCEPEFSITDGFVVTIRRQKKSAGSKKFVSYEVTHEVTHEVKKLLLVLDGAMRRVDIQAKLELKDETNFRVRYLKPALKLGLIEMTIPEKPRSRLQRYDLTEKGYKLALKIKNWNE